MAGRSRPERRSQFRCCPVRAGPRQGRRVRGGLGRSVCGRGRGTALGTGPVAPAGPADADAVSARGQRAGGRDDAFASLYTRWAPEVHSWVRHQLTSRRSTTSSSKSCWRPGRPSTSTALTAGHSSPGCPASPNTRSTTRSPHAPADENATTTTPGAKVPTRRTTPSPTSFPAISTASGCSSFSPAPNGRSSTSPTGTTSTSPRSRSVLGMPVGIVKSHTRGALQHLTHDTRSREAVVGQTTAAGGPRGMARSTLVRPVDEAVTAAGSIRLPDGMRHWSPAVLGPSRVGRGPHPAPCHGRRAPDPPHSRNRGPPHDQCRVRQH
ncbi:hypothetical protein SPARM206S_00040 [Streptomyces parvulus]